jgi:hypothetical protein
MGEKKNGFSQEHRTAELIGRRGENLRGWLLQARWREIGRRPSHGLPLAEHLWNVRERFTMGEGEVGRGPFS